MKRFVILLPAVILLTIPGVQAQQDTAWKAGGDFSLMLSETGYENWAPGGENSVAWNSYFNLFALYEKGKSRWDNNLALAFGQVKTGKRDFRKSEDKIDLTSKYGLKASEKWFYAALFNFKTQFTDGYNYPEDTAEIRISDLLSPGYLSLGIGMEYIPVDYFSIYYSPATARLIIVRDQELADMGAFGVEPIQYDDQGNLLKEGETSRFEFGSAVRLMFRKDIWTNVSLQSKLELFSDYLDNPQNIDINWDNILNFKINDYLSANMTGQIVYDHNTWVTDKDGKTGPRTQFKHTIGVGLAYKF
ncbi:MAG: DUF3078 domain-containing protein [Bacteroidales bacterium]|nr:DUF3078 domain-containing protein [Bacteroidales bacterium]